MLNALRMQTQFVSFEKKPENDFAYKRLKGEGDYKCTNCKSGIEAVGRGHSIWDGLLLEGGGKVQPELIPYCPKCEEKPSSSGRPIRILDISI